MSAPRFVVLRKREDLADVAATWPIGSIERVAMAIYDQAGNLDMASKMAAEQFRDATVVVMELADAEAEVRAHVKKVQRREKSAEYLEGAGR